MLLDFLPESVILGSAAASGTGAGLLLGALIALQNMPEGFAAFHEMRSGGVPTRRLTLLFLAVPLLGPLAAWIGYTWLPIGSHALGLLVLFCSGGILYLIFEDIAPGAKLKHRDFPAVGAVLGFLVGMLGVMVIH